MFCALKGATDTPLRRRCAQIAVAIQLLPAFDEVPPMNSGRAFTASPDRAARATLTSQLAASPSPREAVAGLTGHFT